MTSSYLFYLVYLERRLFPDQYKMTASSKSNNSKATQMYTPNISIKERANESLLRYILILVTEISNGKRQRRAREPEMRSVLEEVPRALGRFSFLHGD